MANKDSKNCDVDCKQDCSNDFARKDVPEREVTKRVAQRGQWRTPPLPAFAACAYSTTAPAATSSNLPTTPDEYARMLQEAYKRGAEAGARALQPAEHIRGPTSVSMPAPATVQYMPPPTPTPPTKGLPVAGTPKSLNIKVVSTNYSSSAASKVPPIGDSGTTRSALVSHSKSMPDMSAFQATLTQVNDEEDKRKKRLARNRASARLRRLKKKNLVDSYEGEVGILESALSKLHSHGWGSDVVDHEALVEALSMERGQQPLTPQRRRESVQSILTQQREQVLSLLECQLENWILCTVATPHNNLSDIQFTSSVPHSNSENELIGAVSELKSLLQLTPRQLSLINKSSLGCVHEVQDLFTVENCLKSIHLNHWLLDEGVDEVAGQFTSVLNPTQLSKFLLWSDHNAEPIEKLDYVNMIVGDGGGPLFEFGVDEGLADGD